MHHGVRVYKAKTAPRALPGDAGKGSPRPHSAKVPHPKKRTYGGSRSRLRRAPDDSLLVASRFQTKVALFILCSDQRDNPDSVPGNGILEDAPLLQATGNKYVTHGARW